MPPLLRPWKTSIKKLYSPCKSFSSDCLLERKIRPEPESFHSRGRNLCNRKDSIEAHWNANQTILEDRGKERLENREKRKQLLICQRCGYLSWNKGSIIQWIIFLDCVDAKILKSWTCSISLVNQKCERASFISRYSKLRRWCIWKACFYCGMECIMLLLSCK